MQSNNQAQPGDTCPQCGNLMTVYCTKRIGSSKVRYIGCRKRGDRIGGCGYTPEQNIQVLPLTAGSTDDILIPNC